MFINSIKIVFLYYSLCLVLCNSNAFSCNMLFANTKEQLHKNIVRDIYERKNCLRLNPNRSIWSRKGVVQISDIISMTTPINKLCSIGVHFTTIPNILYIIINHTHHSSRKQQSKLQSRKIWKVIFYNWRLNETIIYKRYIEKVGCMKDI